MKLNLSALPSVGEIVSVKFKGASFNAKVLDARIRYGNIDALVEPVSGSGKFWTVYTKPSTVTAPPATPESLNYVEDTPLNDLAQEVIDEELETELNEASASIVE